MLRRSGRRPVFGQEADLWYTQPMRYFIPFLLLASQATAAGKTVDCYCTDSSGTRVELGQSICLFVNGRAFTAQCQMSLNNPMWRETHDGCLSSEVDTDLNGDLLDRLEALKPA